MLPELVPCRSYDAAWIRLYNPGCRKKQCRNLQTCLAFRSKTRSAVSSTSSTASRMSSTVLRMSRKLSTVKKLKAILPHSLWRHLFNKHKNSKRQGYERPPFMAGRCSLTAKYIVENILWVLIDRGSRESTYGLLRFLMMQLKTFNLHWKPRQLPSRNFYRHHTLWPLERKVGDIITLKI